MDQNHSNRDRNVLGIGVALIILADVFLHVTLRGAGGLFVFNLITWPLAVVGGVMAGYAIANMLLSNDRRIPRIGFALAGSLVSFTSQNVVYVATNPAADFIPVTQNFTPLGLGIGVVLVSLIELGLVFDKKIGF